MNSNAFELIRGDSANISITVTDDNGDGIDLTGYDVWFTAKRSPRDIDNNAVLTKKVSDGDSEGRVDIDFTPEETNELKPRSYFWDIQLEKDGQVLSTKLQLFRVVADITRRTDEYPS